MGSMALLADTVSAIIRLLYWQIPLFFPSFFSSILCYLTTVIARYPALNMWNYKKDWKSLKRLKNLSGISSSDKELNFKEGLYIQHLELDCNGNIGYLPIKNYFIGRYGICQYTLPYVGKWFGQWHSYIMAFRLCFQRGSTVHNICNIIYWLAHVCCEYILPALNF